MVCFPSPRRVFFTTLPSSLMRLKLNAQTLCTMSYSSRAEYIAELKQQLTRSLCLHSFPCQKVERQTKPEIEVQTDPELILAPLDINYEDDACLIEQSINSTRISFKFKTQGDIEEHLLTTYLRFMMHRAENFNIVRKIPIQDYHISFLITDAHVETYTRGHLVDFIIDFLQGISVEVQQLDQYINSRASAIVDEWWVTAAKLVQD